MEFYRSILHFFLSEAAVGEISRNNLNVGDLVKIILEYSGQEEESRLLPVITSYLHKKDNKLNKA